MDYLARNIDKRLDPTLLLSGARSIIVVAMNYTPARIIPADEYQIAAYALGQDYHDILKQHLRLLCEEFFNEQNGMAERREIREEKTPHALFKICVDTVPILERYWAWQAGIGFIGHNHQLIIPHAGSMFFLGEIITTYAFDCYDQPMENRCGTCQRCIDACPTGALSSFDSRKCLSYQTIENKGSIDHDIEDKMGLSIYGCDRCQQVCPFNRFAPPTDITELQPSDTLLKMKQHDWQQLSVADYQRLFKGSAVKRAKYEGLMRNIRAVSGQQSKMKLQSRIDSHDA